MDNIMDREFTSEVFKLLVMELKEARARLRENEMRVSTAPSASGPLNILTHEREQALIIENDTLKSDNAILQERIARLQNELSQVSAVKAEEDEVSLQHSELMSHLKAELARLLAENEDLRERDEDSRTQERLSTLREKYKRTKAKAHEYYEVLNELRAALVNSTEELEQSRKAAISEVDFRDILKNLPYEPVSGQLGLSSIPCYSGVVYTNLPKNVKDVCKGPYTISHNEVIWSPFGIALGLVIKTTFRYNPKIHGGVWTKVENNFAAGKQLDICYLSSKSSGKSRYLGTYERVGEGTMTITAEALEYLDHEKMDYASRRTTMFPDLLPPSQTHMIRNMYKQGVLKLHCFAIRCIGYNRTFAEKLKDTYPAVIQQNPQQDTATPRGGRKRKRDPASTAHAARNKKKRGSTTE